MGIRLDSLMSPFHGGYQTEVAGMVSGHWAPWCIGMYLYLSAYGFHGKLMLDSAAMYLKPPVLLEWGDVNEEFRGEIRMTRLVSYLIVFASLLFSGCTTTGYHSATDKTLVQKWEVTVNAVSAQNIYNTLGASLVGPLASVESVGLRVKFTDATGKSAEIVQPANNSFLHFPEVKSFDLQPGQKAYYIADRGQVWVQPMDYPLPPELNK